MKLIDLSQPLFDAAPNCPSHPPVSIRTQAHTDGGDLSWQMEYFEFASHTGSHIDAPRHKIAGAATIDQLPLETFCGPAALADLRGIVAETPIGPELLEKSLGDTVLDGHIVLVATGWGDKRVANDLWLHQSPYLTPDGAKWLVRAGIRGFGIDHYSIAGLRELENPHSHTVLLGAGVWIVEELHFPDVVWGLPRPLQFMALPLNLPGASGAPCRPALVVD